MNRYQVLAPERGFSGEACGVVFKDGAAVVSDSTKEGRAAIEYFRRRGYTLTAEAADEEPLAKADPEGGPDEYVVPEGPFDPSEHSVEEVLAYLDHVDRDVAERVIEAEKSGKNRKTIVARGEKQEGQQ